MRFAIWRSAGSACWRRWWRMRSSLARAAAARATCAGVSDAGRDRGSGAGVSGDRGHPAAVAAAGGPAVPCALRCAGDRTFTRCSSSWSLRVGWTRVRWQARLPRCCDRHASLRASFCHEGLSRPVQVIVRGRAAALAAARSVGAGRGLRVRPAWRTSGARIAASGSICSSAPLLRLALIRLGPERAPAGADQSSPAAGWLVDCRCWWASC